MYYSNIQNNRKLEANNVTAEQYNVSKVYINPNFNRQAVLSNIPIHKSAVHINPKFKHQAPISQNVNTNSKVYINPYFLKRNTVLNAKEQTESSYKLEDKYANINSQYTSTNSQMVTQKEKLPCPISKSKYSLVRANQSTVKDSVRHNNNNNKNTIQINKYKSVSISDIKRSNTLNLNKSLVKRLSVKNELLVQKYKKYTHQSCCKNKYKLIKLNKQVTDTVNCTKQTPTKQKSLESRKIHIKLTPSNYRKNNIPCPLFRKYGKCLRKVKGKCQYVHDRKHVAVCRKFLNGNCHDNDCLLAHDSTSNKMPTCYFYLKGMCTKDACPYLHVKLNEKTQICSDFSKGYCENGDKCLKRHVDASEVLKRRKRELQLKNKTNKFKFGTKYQASTQRTATPSKVNVKKLISCESNRPEQKQKPKEDGTDSRYYNKEVLSVEDSDDKCHMIKPSRCKLGTLPSFIKL